MLDFVLSVNNSHCRYCFQHQYHHYLHPHPKATGLVCRWGQDLNLTLPGSRTHVLPHVTPSQVHFAWDSLVRKFALLVFLIVPCVPIWTVGSRQGSADPQSLPASDLFSVIDRASPMAALFSKELGQFSLITSVVLSAVKAGTLRGVPVWLFISVGLSRENRRGSRKGWWVSLSLGVTNDFVNLVRFMKPLSRKNAMIRPTFSPQTTQGSWLRNSDLEG